MKKIVIILSLVLVGVSSYAAGDKKQKSNYPKIKLGVEGGLNIANVFYGNSGSSIPYKFTLTWHGGVYAPINFNDKLVFQPEVLYSVKGVTVSNFYTAHLNYIEMPLLIKYSIGKQFKVLGGVYLAYLVNSSTNLETSVTYQKVQNTTPQGNRVDVGSVIGVEYEWENGLNAGVKYTQGFHNTDPNHGVGFSQNYNLVFSLYVGWTFIKFSGNR